MKIATVLLIALMAAAAPARAGETKEAEGAPASGGSPRTEALRALDAGVTAADPQAILGARATLSMLLEENPGDADLHYWLAVADWRAVPLLQSKDRKAAERQCEAGLAAAEKAIELGPRHAEAIAMLAGLQGVSLGFKNPMAAMTLGPKMAESMEQAVGMAPNNPRVLLLDAINTFHMPSFVGGGAKHALPKLEAARPAFEAEPAAPEHWGHEDVYIWLGRVAMKQKDWSAAETWLKKALEVKPGHAWVMKGLMPEVEAALAKQAG
jgi:tetratricopeptide (TPR) repeat protein